MRKIFIVLFVLLLFIFTGCSKSPSTTNESSIISLPTVNTEQTANGYRNPALAISSKPLSSASQNASSKLENNSASSAKTTYIASKNSKSFHLVDCSSAKRIKEDNIIIFEDFEEATINGYSPCSFCLKSE